MRISDHTLNRLAILKAILRNGPVARTDLPALTSLSAGLITQQTSELAANALISEVKDSASRKGRPRVLLEINGDGAVVIGASIDGTGNLLAAFVSLAGKKLHEARVHFPASATLADMAQNIGNAIKQAIADSPFEAHRIARVGIALPAVIDSARGEVHFNVTFPAAATPFADPISEIVGIPVTIENQMDCMARAEHWFGRARGDEDFLLIHVGNSIDAAEFGHGVPKSGSSGLNSSFGHVKVAMGEDARPCFCGGLGCLSGYSSAFGILQAADLLSDLPFPPIEGLPGRLADYLKKAKRGESEAALAIRQAGTLLGTAVANLINMTSPAKIYISVDNPDYLDLLRNPFDAALNDGVMLGMLSRTSINFFQATEDWRWTGTAALALEQMYLGDHRNDRLRRGREATLAAQAGAPTQPINDNLDGRRVYG